MGRVVVPQDKDFKRLVRERMQNTGETYTQALSNIDTPAPKDVEAHLTYRQAMPGITMENAAGAASLGIKPEHVQAYLAALPGVSIEEIMGAFCLGLLPEHVRRYRMAEPHVTLQAMQRAWVVGLTPQSFG